MLQIFANNRTPEIHTPRQASDALALYKKWCCADLKSTRRCRSGGSGQAAAPGLGYRSLSGGRRSSARRRPRGRARRALRPARDSAPPRGPVEPHPKKHRPVCPAQPPTSPPAGGRNSGIRWPGGEGGGGVPTRTGERRRMTRRRGSCQPVPRRA